MSADRYLRAAAGFDARVRAVPRDAWDQPSPCEGWAARDVVRHLAEWVPGFFTASAGLTFAEVPSVDDDPIAAWAAVDGQLRAWLAEPDLLERTFDAPPGPTSVAAAIDQFVTPDVLVHTWDLARATGLDDRLDPELIAGMVAGMEPFDTMLRESGHYGPRIPVAAGASAQDELLAFLGRDPDWSPR